MDKAWKKRERQVAKFFGCERNPLSGMNSKQTGSDTLHPRPYIEHKHRAKNAAVNLWGDTAEKAKKENKVPVVTLSAKNRRGFWVLVHSSDLAAVGWQRDRVVAHQVSLHHCDQCGEVDGHKPSCPERFGK